MKVRKETHSQLKSETCIFPKFYQKTIFRMNLQSYWESMHGLIHSVMLSLEVQQMTSTLIISLEREDSDLFTR